MDLVRSCIVTFQPWAFLLLQHDRDSDALLQDMTVEAPWDSRLRAHWRDPTAAGGKWRETLRRTVAGGSVVIQICDQTSVGRMIFVR